MRNIFLLTIMCFFIKSIAFADINKEMLELKKEFNQIKEVYENKIIALEEKIKRLESQEEKHVVDDSHKNDGHEKHMEEEGFNIEAVLNGKYTSFTRSGEVVPKGFGVAHEGERGREGLLIGESELIMKKNPLNQ